MADDDESTSKSENEPAPAGEESEPAPAGEEKEPPPAGESSDPPLEDNEGHSDSSAETDSGSSSDSSDGSGSSRRKSGSSGSDSGSDSSSSGDDSSSGPVQSVQPPSEDEVAGALAKAFQARSVPVDDDGVKVTLVDGLYHLGVRLTADAKPLPQVNEDDPSNQASGAVQGAKLMINGAVQIFGDQAKVSMRIVSVETSAILEVGQGTASGGSAVDVIQAAAEDALAGLPSLGAR